MSRTRSRRACATRLRSASSPTGDSPVPVDRSARRGCRKGGTPWSSMRIAPAPPGDLALPGEHGRWGHAERRPALAGEEGSGKGEERPIGPDEPGTWPMPLQHRELMTEHDDLEVLLDAAETMNAKQLDGATDQTAEEREGHDGRGSPRHRSWSSWRSSLCTPQVNGAVWSHLAGGRHQCLTTR